MTATITCTPRNRARLKALPATATLCGVGFVGHGATHARNAALTSASPELAWIGGLSLAAIFEGEFSETTRSSAGKGVVRYAC